MCVYARAFFKIMDEANICRITCFKVWNSVRRILALSIGKKRLSIKYPAGKHERQNSWLFLICIAETSFDWNLKVDDHTYSNVKKEKHFITSSYNSKKIQQRQSSHEFAVSMRKEFI